MLTDWNISNSSKVTVLGLGKIAIEREQTGTTRTDGMNVTLHVQPPNGACRFYIF